MNVQMLVTEMYKVIHSFSLPHVNEIFEVRNKYPYNLRKNYQSCWRLIKIVYYGTVSLSYLGPKVWDSFANIYKNIDGLDKI